MPHIPTVNPPVILRNRQLASKIFGANNMGQPLTAVPRYKYMFFARFVPTPQALALYPWMRNLSSASGGVSFKIKNVDKPKVELNAVELNQYNRKRWAYTKVEYQPVTVRMFDTVDNKPLQLWKDYFMYYFGDSRANKNALMNDSTVGAEFTDGTGWGLRPIAEDLALFGRLELYSLFGKKYTQTTYLNPKIVAVDWQQYDSASSEPDEMSMTLRYEAIEYKNEADIDSGMAQLFGFNGIDTAVVEPENAAVATNYYAMRSYDSEIYAETNGKRTIQNVLNSTRSVVPQFGLNSATYADLEQQVAAATTTYAPTTSLTVSVSYSNNPTITQNILGIPSGSLPNSTVQIAGSATMSSLPAFSSSLSIYGSFNFGNS